MTSTRRVTYTADRNAGIVVLARTTTNAIFAIPATSPMVGNIPFFSAATKEVIVSSPLFHIIDRWFVSGDGRGTFRYNGNYIFLGLDLVEI